MTPTLVTLLNGYSLRTTQGNPAFCSAQLMESAAGRGPGVTVLELPGHNPGHDAPFRVDAYGVPQYVDTPFTGCSRMLLEETS
jgi:hypothetical protein